MSSTSHSQILQRPAWRSSLSLLLLISLFVFFGCNQPSSTKTPDKSKQQPSSSADPSTENPSTSNTSTPSTSPTAFPREDGVAVIITRGLGEGQSHSIAMIDVDPESPRFGEILDQHFLEGLKEPPHHLYYSPAGRLYATCLDPAQSLMEIKLVRDATGKPVIEGVTAIDTGGQQVGEDIIWRTVNGQERFYVTFMGGDGSDPANEGSVAYFDAQTNQLLKVIDGRRDAEQPDKPFVLYPHGLSAYKNFLVVSSCIAPDLQSGIGNTVTLIDMNTDQLLHTYLVAENEADMSSTVEVLFLRPEIHPDFQPGLLVSTMLGNDLWYAPFDETQQTFGDFEKIFVGQDHGNAFPLEFYTSTTKKFGSEMFVSWCVPGVVKRFDLARVPELVENTTAPIVSGAGAHHMIFFQSASGRELIAVQNNLLNLGEALGPDLSAHTITIHDLETGEKLKTIDFRETYQCGVEYIDAIFGSGYEHHH